MKKSAQFKSVLKEILALEKSLKDQMHTLTASMAPKDQPRPPTQNSPKKPPAPFPAALGSHLLTRLTKLEAAADRLAAQAEKQGDYKTALRAIQVSVRLVGITIRLADKHPHVAENWQPPAQVSPSEAAPSPPTSSSMSSTGPALPFLAEPLAAVDGFTHHHPRSEVVAAGESPAPDGRLGLRHK